MSSLNPYAPARCRLDTGEGLNRLMGEHPLYLQLLRRFGDDYAGVAPNITAMLARGEALQARRLAHSLKGSAGLIGAQLLHDLAAGIENAAAAEEDAGALLAQLEPLLHKTLDDISSYLAHFPAPAPVEEQDMPDAARVRALLDTLTRLLHEGNGAAIDLVEQSAPVLACALGVPTFQMVAAAAHAFDFEGALDALGTEL